MNYSPHSQVDIVNESLKTILAPYIDERGYGDLGILSLQPTPQERAEGIETPGWLIMYTGTTGKPHLAELRYDMSRGIFNYSDNFGNRKEGIDAEETEKFLKRLPGLVRKQRKRDMADFARTEKANGLKLDDVVKKNGKSLDNFTLLGPNRRRIIAS